MKKKPHEAAIHRLNRNKNMNDNDLTEECDMCGIELDNEAILAAKGLCKPCYFDLED